MYPGYDSLSIGEASVETEGAGAGGTVSVIEAGYIEGTSGGNWTFYASGNVQDGDLLLAMFSGNHGQQTITKSGWNSAASLGYSNRYIARLWKIWHTGDPTSYAFTVDAAYYFAVSWTIRGADQTTPIAGETQAGTNNWATPTGPSITLTRDNCLLLWMLNESGTQQITAPSGFTSLGGGGGDPYMFSSYKTGVNAGATGDKVGSRGATNECSVVMYAIQPAAQAQGSYYRWTVNDAVNRAFGYRLEPQNSGSAYRFGEVDAGYKIEVRYPIAEGGSELDGDHSVTVKTYAGTPVDYYKWHPNDMPTVIVYPCVYQQLPQPIPSPIDGLGPGECQTTADLASIARAICRMEYRLTTLEGYLLNINTLTADMSGPWNASVGQASEAIEGTLGSFVQQAVRAMSNYIPESITQGLLAQDQEGDSQHQTTGDHIFVNITQIPASAGHREGDPPLYDVNRRVNQLGWVSFEYDGKLTPWQQLVYTAQYIRAPNTIPAILHLHLAPGVIANVSECHEVYAPIL